MSTQKFSAEIIRFFLRPSFHNKPRAKISERVSDLLCGITLFNRRYCEQYADTLEKVKAVITQYLVQDTYVTCRFDFQKEGTMALQRLMDWLERFVIANEALIKDHDTKVRIGKKTRRVKPDRLFRETTRLMG